MACRCIDMKNCLKDIVTMKEIIKEFSELEKNTQKLNENLNNISRAGILSTHQEKILINNHKKINKELVDKTPLIINECNIRMEELEKQYEIIMEEDHMYHNMADK